MRAEPSGAPPQGLGDPPPSPTLGGPAGYVPSGRRMRVPEPLSVPCPAPARRPRCLEGHRPARGAAARGTHGMGRPGGGGARGGASCRRAAAGLGEEAGGGGRLCNAAAGRARPPGTAQARSSSRPAATGGRPHRHPRSPAPPRTHGTARDGAARRRSAARVGPAESGSVPPGGAEVQCGRSPARTARGTHGERTGALRPPSPAGHRSAPPSPAGFRHRVHAPNKLLFDVISHSAP